jgi:hypothetical protein
VSGCYEVITNDFENIVVLSWRLLSGSGTGVLDPRPRLLGFLMSDPASRLYKPTMVKAEKGDFYRLGICRGMAE